MKIASTKKEIPSSANPKPNTSPNADMKPGHRSPISKLRIVPVTTPTANRASIAFDQRLASWRYSGSPVRRCSHSTTSDERRKGDPEAHERDVHGEGQRLHLAGLQQVVLVDPGEGVGDQRDDGGTVIGDHFDDPGRYAPSLVRERIGGDRLQSRLHSSPHSHGR